MPGPEATKVRNRWRPTWIVTYAPANRPARLPNAAGIAIASTSEASMIAISSARTAFDSGSSSFVTQVV